MKRTSRTNLVWACLPVVITVLLGSHPAVAADADTPQLQEDDATLLKSMDAPRAYLSSKFVNFVEDVDRYFGSDLNYQETNDSVLQLSVHRVTGYGQERLALSGRAKVHLPRTEKRLHLLLETDPEKNSLAEASQGISTPSPDSIVKKPDSYAAGIRYENIEQEHFHYSADWGIKFHGLSTTPFVRARGSYANTLGHWSVKAAESLFWFNTTGVGESTEVDFDRPISDTLLFRAASNATWLRDTLNFDLRQDFSLFHTMSDRATVLYQASAIGVTRPQTQATDYVFTALLRYRLHHNWMFAELGPQLHFPKDRDYRASKSLGMRLEVLFDRK